MPSAPAAAPKDGRAEILGRLAETAAQVVTRGFNDLAPSQARAVAAALDGGARVRMEIEMTPRFRVLVAVVSEDGSAVEVFRAESSGQH